MERTAKDRKNDPHFAIMSELESHLAKQARKDARRQSREEDIRRAKERRELIARYYHGQVGFA